MSDVLIVGAGLYGATVAQRLREKGKSVLLLEKRPHIGGNVYTEALEGIQVHRYGAHVFHTDDARIWDYVNRFAVFNRYTDSPVANFRGELYSLPFNMYTFNRLWGVVTPREAERKIAEQRAAAGIAEPKNLEEQAISLVGTELYEKLVRGYAEKQWGCPCSALPASLIRRLPLRFTYDNSSSAARYQGIPIGGYTAMVAGMLEGVEVRLGVDYLAEKSAWDRTAKAVVYTGAIDRYFAYRFGPLGYRSLRFESEVLDTPNFQGNAVVHYTDRETPYTRIIEHKHFEFGTQPRTVITREYSRQWQPGDEPYFPIGDGESLARYEQYRALANRELSVWFGGRLGEYRHYDMDAVIAAALDTAETLPV